MNRFIKYRKSYKLNKSILYLGVYLILAFLFLSFIFFTKLPGNSRTDLTKLKWFPCTKIRLTSVLESATYWSYTSEMPGKKLLATCIANRPSLEYC